MEGVEDWAGDRGVVAASTDHSLGVQVGLWERNWARAAGRLRHSLSQGEQPMIACEGHAWSCPNGWPEILMRMKNDVRWQRRERSETWVTRCQGLRRESGLMLTAALGSDHMKWPHFTGEHRAQRVSVPPVSRPGSMPRTARSVGPGPPTSETPTPSNS